MANMVRENAARLAVPLAAAAMIAPTAITNMLRSKVKAEVPPGVTAPSRTVMSGAKDPFAHLVQGRGRIRGFRRHRGRGSGVNFKRIMKDVGAAILNPISVIKRGKHALGLGKRRRRRRHR